MRKTDHALQQRAGTRQGGLDHDAAVDLHAVDWVGAQVGERGIARADIVQHDAKPHRVQPLDRPQRRLAVVRKVVLLDDLAHAREDLFVCDGLAREVAREPQRPAPLPLPRLELHARAAEHIEIQLGDRAGADHQVDVF